MSTTKRRKLPAAPMRSRSDLNFIERQVFNFALYEECERAKPKDRASDLVDRAMRRVGQWLDAGNGAA